MTDQQEVKEVIYSRVSKENEKMQDIEVQEEKIRQRFDLEDPIILRERGSAYRVENFHKREQLIRLMKYAFNMEKTTISDLFLGQYKKRKVNLYVWDSHRIMRNIEFSLLFLLLSDLFDMRIFTYKDGDLKGEEQETPSKKLLRYMVMTIHAYSGEEYSYTTSENIKKAFVKHGSVTYSKKGKKVGRRFKKGSGEKIGLTKEQLDKLNNRIKELHKMHIKRGDVGYYKDIIRQIEHEQDLIISKPYISRLK